ncbi:MAG: hypothetical protein EPO67_20435 [Reyranella sp.]|nr:MAG: hypothetical protein EPO67_20435 [Reyranella sp.]
MIKLQYGRDNATVFKGQFSGTLSAAFPYTQFSLFVNPALWPGWTRDAIHAVGAGVEVLIEYSLDGRTRSEFYDPNSKFNLQPQNTWLNNNNNLTEFATTTVPLRRGAKLNPLKPKIDGDDFERSPRVSNGTVTVSIWASAASPKRSDIYLACDCSPSSQRASWIKVPYQ